LGVREEDIARIAAPIGLHLGAVDPEEVAVAIAAEIVQLKRHGRAARLSETTGPLHDREIVVDSGRGRAAKLTRAGSTTSHPE
jgi:xanthine/CO dehydrogenase XdhC/CoxF family maturation factor